MVCTMRDLSSLIGDRTLALALGVQNLTTGPPGKSLPPSTLTTHIEKDKSLLFRVRQNRVLILALLSPSCEIWSKTVNLSEPQCCDL